MVILTYIVLLSSVIGHVYCCYRDMETILHVSWILWDKTIEVGSSIVLGLQSTIANF